MTEVDLVSDGELIVNYALQNKLTLPPDSASTLLVARSKLEQLTSPGPDRVRFYAALQSAVDAIPISASAIRASEQRRLRLDPLVQDAQSLLAYASANAKKVDDDVRNPLVAVSDSVARGTPTPTDEQVFFKAYEGLTVRAAPVTAETLIASRTTMLDLGRLFSRAGFWSSCRELTLGRVFNAILFLVVLIATGVALGYYSLGETSLRHYQDLNAEFVKANIDWRKDEILLTLRKEAAEREQQKSANSPEAIELSRKNVLEAEAQLVEHKAIVERLEEQGAFLPDRLLKWARRPCGSWLTAWALCSAVDELSASKGEASLGFKVEAARTVASRMSEVVLPLLLGWLGAHAFVLQNMTSAINGRYFAKASFLRHMIRLSLGALAGIASTWILTAPEMVAGVQLKSMPAWALAFVAGYGIELVFSFMDRIVAAFTTKTP